MEERKKRIETLESSIGLRNNSVEKDAIADNNENQTYTINPIIAVSKRRKRFDWRAFWWASLIGVIIGFLAIPFLFNIESLLGKALGALFSMIITLLAGRTFNYKK